MKRFRPSVVILDALVLILFFAASVIFDTGGAAWRSGGRRYSIQDPWRPLMWGAGLLLVRFLLHGRVGPFGRRWRAIVQGLGLSEDLGSTPQAPVPSWRELGLVLAGLIAATAAIFHVQVVNLFLVPDLGDPLFSMWRMAWVTHQIVADPWHLFDANIFYPEQATLTFSDSMILPALTAAPLLWAGVHPVVAYTLLFLSGFVLSGLTTYALARAIGLGPAAAWIGALVFGFYPYRIDHYSHLELQMAQWVPIALLAVHRLLAIGRARYAVLLAVAVGAQWFSSMYYGLFLMAYASAFAGILAIVWRPGWRRVGYVVCGLGLGIVLAFPLARAYSSSESSRRTRPRDAIQLFSARPSDYLQPTTRSALYREYGVHGRIPERDLFPGVVPLALSVAGAVPPFTATRLAVIAAGLIAFDGSLGLNGHWYPLAHRLVPAFQSVRVPARFAIFVGLTLAVLSAFGVAWLWTRIASASRRRLCLPLLTLAVMADVWPYLELQPVWKDPPSLYASLGPKSNAVLFEFPLHPHPDWFAENIPYMYFSIWHWTKMVNGYSGSSPLSYWTMVESTVGFPKGSTVDYLQRSGVTHVTLHCGLWDAPACHRTMTLLDDDARFRMVASTRWEGAESRLYELRQ